MKAHMIITRRKTGLAQIPSRSNNALKAEQGFKRNIKTKTKNLIK